MFSVRPEKGRYELPKFPPGVIGMMVQIWKEPRDNQKLLSLFEIESTEKLPLLLLFTEINGEYLSIQFKINDASENEAYNTTKEHLEFACSVISGIKKENYGNPEGIFAALSLQNDQRQAWKILKNGINIYAYIKGLLP